MKNLLLSYIGDWAIDKEVLSAAKEALPNIIKFGVSDGQEDISTPALDALIKEPLRETYTCPIFTKQFCAILADEIKHMNFTPNTDEDVLRQIPECILSQNYPELNKSLLEVVMSLFNPLFFSIWGRSVVGGNIQVAKYNPANKKKGAWHHDASSDFTVVVPLNTGDYEGGGTEFYKRGVLQPLPNGTALMFPSLTHLHRGLEVENGDRLLLVFWLICNNEDKYAG